MTPSVQRMLALALLLLGGLLGFLFLIRPALEEKSEAEKNLSALQTGVSPKNETLPQLKENPSQEEFVRFVQKAAAAESVEITNLSWKGSQLQIESKTELSRVASLAERISNSVRLDKKIQVKGPGVFPVSMSSNFLPRSTLYIDSLYNLSQ